jgi:hypothetical protein
MATRVDNPASDSALLERATAASRALLEYRFVVYSTIVARKHGIPAPLQTSSLSGVSDTELQSIVEAMRDMAHLPPA